jgi:hypothetical protein
MLKAAHDEAFVAVENRPVSEFHFPGFWKIPENWSSNDKALGTPSSNRVRTKEAKRGEQESGLEEPMKRLYLKARTDEKSDHAKRKVTKNNEAKYGDNENEIEWAWSVETAAYLLYILEDEEECLIEERGNFALENEIEEQGFEAPELANNLLVAERTLEMNADKRPEWEAKGQSHVARVDQRDLDNRGVE